MGLGFPLHEMDDPVMKSSKQPMGVDCSSSTYRTIDGCVLPCFWLEQRGFLCESWEQKHDKYSLVHNAGKSKIDHAPLGRRWGAHLPLIAFEPVGG